MARAATVFDATSTTDLKHKSVRGAAAASLAQMLTFSLQMISTMVLARILSPAEFGLQGMVVAVTGFLGLFREAGLSAATVQRDVLTEEQASTLFWVNACVGVLLTLATATMAPAMVVFYREPRVFWMMIVAGTVFVFNGVTVQHRALLDRRMRFVTVAIIDVTALVFSVGIGIGMAVLGFGYWALVAMPVSNSVVAAAGVWIATPWVPGRPVRQSGIRSMLHIGGIVSLNILVVYLGYNAEKMLLGRFWGATALGLYGRAYQLANLPVQQLNFAIGAVAFPALSRMQNDAERLQRAFLRGYSVVVSLTIPVVIICAVYAEEVVRVLLGSKWTEAALVLRLLMPTVLAFALINPFSWFLQATGRFRRSLNMAFLIAPIVIFGVAAGLHYGLSGVAIGYSVAMISLVAPLVAWAKSGTGITTTDYLDTIKRPLISGLIAGLAGGLFKFACAGTLSPLATLILGPAISLGVYAWVLLIVTRQRALYGDLLNQVFQRQR